MEVEGNSMVTKLKLTYEPYMTNAWLLQDNTCDSFPYFHTQLQISIPLFSKGHHCMLAEVQSR